MITGPSIFITWIVCEYSIPEFSKDFHQERIFLFKLKVINLLSKHCLPPQGGFKVPLEIEKSKITSNDFNNYFFRPFFFFFKGECHYKALKIPKFKRRIIVIGSRKWVQIWSWTHLIGPGCPVTFVLQLFLRMEVLQPLWVIYFSSWLYCKKLLTNS